MLEYEVEEHEKPEEIIHEGDVRVFEGEEYEFTAEGQWVQV